MSSSDLDVDADALTDEAIAELKRREAAGRDAGAEAYLRSIRGSRSAFRRRAEEITLLDAIAPREGQTVLDAGSGVGRFALSVAPRCRRLVCVDFSNRALEVLASEAERRGIQNIATQASDLCALVPLDETFDTIYSFETFQHIPSDRERLLALKNLRALLKPKGRLIVSALCWNARVGRPKEGFWGDRQKPGAYCHYFTPAELEAMMRGAGFSQVRLRGLLLLPGRLTRRLPPALAILELALSRLRVGVGHGRLLIAIAS